MSSLKVALENILLTADRVEHDFLTTIGNHQTYHDNGLIASLGKKIFAPVKYLDLLKKTADQRKFTFNKRYSETSKQDSLDLQFSF